MSTCHDGSGAAARPVLLQTPRIALVGAPNSGKTSVFNHLTGSHQRTANYPGVTVTRTVGEVRAPARPDGGRSPRTAPAVLLEDLPGTYSLTPASPDEEVVAEVLAGDHGDVPPPDAVLLVADATVLRRTLSLLAAVLDLGRPVALVLTMVDELAARGGGVDPAALSRALGVAVVPVVGHRGQGVPALRELLPDPSAWAQPAVPPPTQGTALRAWADSVLDAAAYHPPSADPRTRRLDAVLLHPVWGTVVFLVTMALFFQAIFTLATPLVDAVDGAFAGLGGWVAEHVGPPLLADFLATAIIGGVGGVLVFLPQILLLFLMISLLENIGYMARAAFLMDRVMAVSGLDGRAFVSMLSSVACAVPGIMSTRTIPSSRDRIATIMAAPLMTCSARLPVYLLLVSLLVDDGARWGPFGAQGLVLFGLYLLGGVSAMVAAWAFKTTVLRSGSLPFYLELPPYRVPAWRTVAVAVWHAASAFVRKVGTIILGTTVVLWALLTFPGPQLQDSYAAAFGRLVEPVFAPLGFDWRICVGLVGAMAAREVFVSTLGQIITAQDPENPISALSTLTYDHGAHAGDLVFTAPTVAALLVFFVYALQCFATIAVMRRETNSWRWPLVAFVYMGVLAYAMALLARLLVGALVG